MTRQVTAIISAMPDDARTCGRCDDGWVCEQHPEQPWPHPDPAEADGECAGPGMRCGNPDCPLFTEWMVRNLGYVEPGREPPAV